MTKHAPYAFHLNPIGRDFQIYGGVTGWAIHKKHKNQNTYTLHFRFFVDSKLIKIDMSEQDQTVHTEQAIIDRIQQTITDCLKEEGVKKEAVYGNG